MSMMKKWIITHLLLVAFWCVFFLFVGMDYDQWGLLFIGINMVSFVGGFVASQFRTENIYIYVSIGLFVSWLIGEMARRYTFGFFPFN